MKDDLLINPGYIPTDAEAQDIIDRCRTKYETSELARRQVEKYRLASLSALEFAALQLQVVIEGTRGDQGTGLDQIMAVAEAFTLLEASVAEVRSINNAVAVMLLTEGAA